MEDKKYQIFISSTYNDLIEARSKIIETILNLYHLPVGMEMYSADDDEQWEIIKDTIDTSDYYVIIVGHRYGTQTKSGISFTEKEYNYAKRQKIPILAFIRNRDISTKPSERDEDSIKIEKLKKFIKKVSKNKMCDFWETEDDLATKVAIALPKIFRKNPRTGWIRADRVMSLEVSEELARLSKSNSKLREEIENLYSNIKIKLPKIEILLNESKLLKLNFKEFSKQEIGLLDYCKRFNKKDIPEDLINYISDIDIKKYNNSLPSKSRIDKYNYDMELYWRKINTSHILNFTIVNNGNIKASDIYVELSFHKEVLVIEKDELEDIKPPGIHIPKNPIELALEREKEKFRKSINPLFELGKSFEAPSLISPISPISSYVTPINYIPPEIEIEDNIINIHFTSLLHTMRKEFYDLYLIIPLVSGLYKINVSIMCEQYSEKDNFTFPISVENK